MKGWRNAMGRRMAPMGAFRTFVAKQTSFVPLAAIGFFLTLAWTWPLFGQEGNPTEASVGAEKAAGGLEKLARPEIAEQSEQAEKSEEEGTSSSAEIEPKAGDPDRVRAEELRAGDLDLASAESLELSILELRLGLYEQLIERLSELGKPNAEDASQSGQVSLLTSRATTGPLPSALAPSERVSLLRNLAAAHVALGQRAEAVALYQQLNREFNDLVSQAELGRLLSLSGQYDQAEQLYYGLIRAYNQRPRMTAENLQAVGVACKELGRNNPQLFKDALRSFDQAIASFGEGPEANLAKIELARLFIEKYDSTQAREALQPVLATENPTPAALFAAALVERFDGGPRVRPLALTALEINPRFIEALILLAELETEAEDRESASGYIDQALAVNPNSLAALTLSAGIAFLDEDGERFEALREQVFGLNARYADFWVELALVAMRNRLYPQALDFAQAAVDLDEKSWRGWGELGLNQLRLGKIDKGRQSLERAFAGDPYNVWNKNTLELLDQLVEYRVVDTEHFQVVLHESEADLLGPIVGAIAERSYRSLASRYGFEPANPIRIEVYPSHEDFSVRTVGLSGLGALGVSFGPLIAIDSPAARGIGDFNWGTTLWHEIAHTFTLGLSKGKIPRWFTEGLSVYEERQGPVGWTDDPTPEFLAAFADDRLLGLEAMNDGFVRPSYPNQIGLSYYQASLVAEYIDRTWGFEQIVEMLEAYAEGNTTEQIVADQFELTLEEFDARFWDYLEDRFAVTMPTFRGSAVVFSEAEIEDSSDSTKAIELIGGGGVDPGANREQVATERPEDFRAQLAYGQELLGEENWQTARVVLERARDLFPEYAGPGSPYHGLAQVAVELEETEAAATALRSLVDLNEYAFDAHLELAALYEELNRPEDELEVLGRSIYIYPYQPLVHERMAELAGNVQDLDQRIRALRSVLALRPSSRPRLLFELASTYRDLGQVFEAKKSVLGALELAPSYAKAQVLLLELVEASAADGSDS